MNSWMGCGTAVIGPATRFSSGNAACFLKTQGFVVRVIASVRIARWGGPLTGLS